MLASLRDRPRLAALLVAYALLGPLTYFAAAQPAGARFAPYLGVHAIALTLMALAWRTLQEDPHPDAVRAVVGTGVLTRLGLLFVPTFTTTDVGRYLWDGAVALAGHDPYALRPDSVALAAVRATHALPADHLDVPTCYPPLAIALFSACAAFGPHAWLAWKALVTAVSCATVVGVWRGLRDSPRAPHVALLALSPLALLETGVGAHLDVLVAAALAIAAIAIERRDARVAALAVGVAAALKLTPGVLIVVVLARTPRRLEALALFATPLVVSIAAALAHGWMPLGSLPLVARTWSFGSPVFALLQHLAPTREDEVRVALLVSCALLVSLVAWTRPRRRALGEALGVSLATSTTLYPWYASALAPLSALAPNRWTLALTAVLPLGYEVIDRYQANGVWSPATWPIVLTASAPIFALLSHLRPTRDAPLRGWRPARVPS